MNKLKSVIVELLESEIELSNRMGTPIVKPSQRNELKKKLQIALMEDINEALSEVAGFVIVGETADGVVLAVEPKSLAKRVSLSVIPIQFEVKIKNLDYDTEFEIDDFEAIESAKEKAKTEKAKAKAEQIIYDTKRRKEEKEARIAELAKLEAERE